jgi:hypothetical protein
MPSLSLSVLGLTGRPQKLNTAGNTAAYRESDGITCHRRMAVSTLAPRLLSQSYLLAAAQALGIPITAV